jgi:hypothetical protein
MKKEFKIRKFVKAALLGSTIIALALVVDNLYGQKKDKDNPPKSNDNQPKVSIKVDKQTDKNGNITRYDSTYTWSWSGNGNIPNNADSVVKNMHEHFFKGFSFNDKAFNNRDFFNDSAFMNGNFEEDFGMNFGNMNKMLAEQEKMMRKYFDEEPILKVPDGVTPQPPKAQEKKEKKPKKQQSLIQDNSYTTQL